MLKKWEDLPAEMRCPGAVFEGVMEDDFYRENYSAGA